jgi:uncharacterized membrane protein
MTLIDGLDVLSWLDLAALLFLLLSWVGIAWRIQSPRFKRRSVSLIMHKYRQEWMRELVTREPRIFDATILSTLRQGTVFFASSSMIAIGGGLALIGNPEPLANVANDLTSGQTPEVVLEIKILLILFFLVSAFLRFVWAHRLFGYCAVLMAAVPNDPHHPEVHARADQAGDLNGLAARSYNSGMRSVYFGLGATGWLAGPVALIVCTMAVTAMIWRREFASRSRNALLGPGI